MFECCQVWIPIEFIVLMSEDGRAAQGKSRMQGSTEEGDRGSRILAYTSVKVRRGVGKLCSDLVFIDGVDGASG